MVAKILIQFAKLVLVAMDDGIFRLQVSSLRFPFFLPFSQNNRGPVRSLAVASRGDL